VHVVAEQLRPLALSLLAVAALQACSMEPAVPASARVRVDVPPTASGTPVWLVTSFEFQYDPDADSPVYLARADTVQLTAPFDRDVEIGSHGGANKLYVEVRSVDGRSVSTRLRVTIENQPWYDRTLDLSEWFHRFSYVRARG
jgi:hypothetical protein